MFAVHVWLWRSQVVVVLFLFTFHNALWTKIAVLYLVLVSLIANVATYSSGRQAAKAKEATLTKKAGSATEK